MESQQNLKVIQEAINQLLVEEEEDGYANGTSVHRRTLLSDLRTQLEQENCEPDESESPSPGHVNTHSCDEIVEELNKVKRQNLITHGLLSAMILVTLTWQLSEVSLILKIKHVLSSPLESLGGIAKRFFNGQPKVNVNVQQVMKQVSSIKDKVSFESPSIPELPQLELPGFDTSEEE
ncbi:uncharacterized protein LOC142541368 [Primulina tabacum]|uniref:uncharacterized protein LOC142541368 n=1 Tax=Primulina tabacum TaxID=48773 RepID=UPI003F5A799F